MQAWRDLNPQPPGLEPGALHYVELQAYFSFLMWRMRAAEATVFVNFKAGLFFLVFRIPPLYTFCTLTL